MRNKELSSKNFIDKIQQIYASSKLTNIDNNLSFCCCLLAYSVDESDLVVYNLCEIK